jgi:hypothetical protein
MNKQAGQQSPKDSIQRSQCEKNSNSRIFHLGGYIIERWLTRVQLELFQSIEFEGLNKITLSVWGTAIDGAAL